MYLHQCCQRSNLCPKCQGYSVSFAGRDRGWHCTDSNPHRRRTGSVPPAELTHEWQWLKSLQRCSRHPTTLLIPERERWTLPSPVQSRLGLEETGGTDTYPPIPGWCATGRVLFAHCAGVQAGPGLPFVPLTQRKPESGPCWVHNGSGSFSFTSDCCFAFVS